MNIPHVFLHASIHSNTTVPKHVAVFTFVSVYAYICATCEHLDDVIYLVNHALSS